MKRFGFLVAVAAPAVALMTVGCSSTSSTGAGDISMENLPSSSEFLSSGASSSTTLRLASVDASSVITARALMEAIEDDAIGTLDAYFWGGSTLSTIDGLGTLDGDPQEATLRDAFFQGQNKCFVMDSLIRSYTELESAATSGCYVQGMARLDSDFASALRQESSDKLLKINPLNMPAEGDEEGGDFSVWVNVVGSDKAEDGEYKLEFSFCTNGVVDGQETLTFNVNTGAYTSMSVNSRQEGGGTHTFESTLSATAVDQGDGTYAFEGARSFTGHGGHSQWGTFKTQISMGDDGLLTIRQRHTSGDNSNSGKNYLVGSIDGSSFKEGTDSPVKILEAGYAGLFEGTGWSHDQFGAFQYDSTATPKYSNTSSGDLYSTVQAFMGSDHDGFDTDEFFSGSLAAPTVSLSFDCSQTPDKELDMDFSKTDVANLQVKCERSFRDARICDGDAVSDIMNKVFSSFN